MVEHSASEAPSTRHSARNARLGLVHLSLRLTAPSGRAHHREGLCGLWWQVVSGDQFGDLAMLYCPCHRLVGDGGMEAVHVELDELLASEVGAE